MKKIILITLFIATTVFGAPVQNKTKPGLLWDDESYERLQPYPAGVRSFKRGGKVDLSSYCPTPGDQCDQLSCVGWALAHAMTTRWAKQSNNTDSAWINARMFAPSFIYNQVKEDKSCDSGAYLTKALTLAAEQGVCLLKSMPYDCCCCEKEPDKAQRKEAAGNKITAIQRLYSLKDLPQTRLDNTLTALDRGNPVIVAMMVTPNFKSVVAGEKRWSPDREELLGGHVEGHAAVVVGYDEDAALITLLNSYGTGWADSGLVDISFDDFKAQARYGVVVSIGRK